MKDIHNKNELYSDDSSMASLRALKNNIISKAKVSSNKKVNTYFI